MALRESAAESNGRGAPSAGEEALTAETWHGMEEASIADRMAAVKRSGMAELCFVRRRQENVSSRFSNLIFLKDGESETRRKAVPSSNLNLDSPAGEIAFMKLPIGRQNAPGEFRANTVDCKLAAGGVILAS